MLGDFVALAFARALEEKVCGRSPAGAAAQAKPLGEKPIFSDSSMRTLCLNVFPSMARSSLSVRGGDCGSSGRFKEEFPKGSFSHLPGLALLAVDPIPTLAFIIECQ